MSIENGNSVYNAAVIEAIRQFCLDNMAEAIDDSLTDIDTIWPSEVLDVIDAVYPEPAAQVDSNKAEDDAPVNVGDDYMAPLS